MVCVLEQNIQKDLLVVDFAFSFKVNLLLLHNPDIFEITHTGIVAALVRAK